MKNAFFSAAHPLVFGHRGSSGDMPENTLPSFDKALADGADVLETDIHITKDGCLVISHDETLGRCINGTGNIADHTLAELKQMDAAYNFTLDNGKTFPYRGKGISIPTLEEAFQRYPGVRFNIDMKMKNEKLVNELARLIKKYHREDITIVASFSHKNIRHMRSGHKDIPLTAASQVEVILSFLASKFHIHASKKTVAVEPPSRIVTEQHIKNAHARGHYIVPWVVNDPKEMEKLFKMGVDGIITNYPRKAAKIAQKFKR